MVYLTLDIARTVFKTYSGDIVLFLATVANNSELVAIFFLNGLLVEEESGVDG